MSSFVIVYVDTQGTDALNRQRGTDTVNMQVDPAAAGIIRGIGQANNNRSVLGANIDVNCTTVQVQVLGKWPGSHYHVTGGNFEVEVQPPHCNMLNHRCYGTAVSDRETDDNFVRGNRDRACCPTNEREWSLGGAKLSSHIGFAVGVTFGDTCVNHGSRTVQHVNTSLIGHQVDLRTSGVHGEVTCQHSGIGAANMRSFTDSNAPCGDGRQRDSHVNFVGGLMVLLMLVLFVFVQLGNFQISMGGTSYITWRGEITRGSVAVHNVRFSLVRYAFLGDTNCHHAGDAAIHGGIIIVVLLNGALKITQHGDMAREPVILYGHSANCRIAFLGNTNAHHLGDAAIRCQINCCCCYF